MVLQKNRGHNVSHRCSALRHGKTPFIVHQRKGPSSVKQLLSKKRRILIPSVLSSYSALKLSLRKWSKSHSHCVTRKMSRSICSVLPQAIPQERQQRCASRVTS